MFFITFQDQLHSYYTLTHAPRLSTAGFHSFKLHLMYKHTGHHPKKITDCLLPKPLRLCSVSGCMFFKLYSVVCFVCWFFFLQTNYILIQGDGGTKNIMLG